LRRGFLGGRQALGLLLVGRGRRRRRLRCTGGRGGRRGRRHGRGTCRGRGRRRSGGAGGAGTCGRGGSRGGGRCHRRQGSGRHQVVWQGRGRTLCVRELGHCGNNRLRGGLGC